MTTSKQDSLTHEVIGAAIEVHRHLGPGVLESVYEECLCFELSIRDVPFERQIPLPVVYKGKRLELGFRPDLIVAGKVLVEIKCVEKLHSAHEAQLITICDSPGWELGC